SSTILDAGSGFASYIWNTGDLTQSISASTSGNYVVTVTDNNGCSGIVNHNLTVESAVQVTASSFSCNLNNTQYQLQFEIIDGDPNTYNVSGMTGSLTSNSPYIFVGDPQNNGNSYNITVTDGNSCGTVNLVGSYNCGCAASASIDGGGVICSAGSNTQTSIDITLIGAPPWDIVYTDGVNNYPVNNILASPYSFNTSTPGTYTLISVADANCNAGSVSGYADVLISQNTPVISGPSSYCEGSTVTLDAGGGYSLYTWSDAAGIIGNNQSILVSSPGQYDLQVEDVHGCTFSDNVLLVEHEKVITSNLMVTCDPNGLNYVVSFEISGGDPTTYNVSGNTGSISGNGPYIFTSDPIASGVPYAFDVTDVNSCNTISLSGLRDCSCAADAVISGGGNICPGGGSTASIDVVLSGTGPWEITYFDGQNNTIVNNIFTSPYTFSPSSGGTFTLVSVSDANCLGGSVSGIAVVNEVVGSPTISGPNSFCEGNTIVLDAGLGYSSYVWSDGLNNLGTNQAINVNSGGAYFITATDLMGCVHNMSHNVTELQKIDILNLSSNCNISGADYVVSFEISNGDPTTYSVTGNPGTLTNSLPYIFTSAAITQGTPYNFVVEDGNQCNTQNISGSQSCQCAATAQISGGGIVCRDGSATTNITIDLTGTAPWDITYSDGSNNYNVTGILQSPHIIPVSDSGSYVLIDVTDANCSGGSVSGLAVVDYSNVQVGIFGPSEYCTGDQIILEALGGNFQSYLWSTNEITSSISVGLAGVFFVDAIDQYGCNSSDTVTVKENPRPIPVITGDKSYCKGNTALLDAGPGFLTYNWSNGVNTQTNNVEHGVYVVVVSDQNGCFGNSGPWEVFENDVPNVDIAGPEVLCGDQSVVLDATTAEADDYLWLHDNSIDSVAEVLVEGEFIVHASNHCGIGKDTINILKVELPEITLGPDRAYCAGDIGELIQLVAIEGASYQWFERSEELGFSANNILVKDTGLYSVSVFYQGCIVTDTLDMTSSKCKGYCEVYVPNAFTPDGTGLNEKFTPITLEQCQFDTYRFTVFNRWGDLLFTSQTPGEGWDGHFNGILSELGVYLWKLEYVDSNANVKEKRYGTVTLLR
ncbi:MAG: gliding motility-associated C-terminal domain-containing protein, partial [Flavobacteriales bacterium]|nr:gliding motility-associated C-terminal domain-containing protein [Flavobacteriales bacterium]